MEPIVQCPTCNTHHTGIFCHQCGEKRLSYKERSLFVFYRDEFLNLLSLEIKFFSSLWLLLFQPGGSAKKYSNGERKEWVKPLQLLAFSNILFYLVFIKVSIFYIRIDDMAIGHDNWPNPKNYFHYDVAGSIKSVADRFVTAAPDADKDIEDKANDYSKALLVLIVPAMGFLLHILVPKQKDYQGAHILSIGNLTFYMLGAVAYISILFNMGFTTISDVQLLPFHCLFGLYTALGIHHLYTLSWPKTILITLVLVGGFFIFLSIYRQLMLILAIILYKKDAQIQLLQQWGFAIVVLLILVNHFLGRYRKRIAVDKVFANKSGEVLKR